MSENQPVPQSSTDLGLVAYICFAVGFVTGGIGSVIGVVIAYLQLGEVEGTWRESHFTWLIRTFWIGLLGGFVCLILMVVIIGFFLSFALFIWFVIRIVKGWMAFDKQQPVPNPESWLFG